jgi:hypothetical protein
MSVGRQLQFLHCDVGRRSIEMFTEHMSYTCDLLTLRA